MANASVTNTFAAGTTIQASQVNANFTDLLNFLNTTGVHVYQAATIETAALEDDAVTVAKIAETGFPGRRVAAPTIATSNSAGAGDKMSLAVTGDNATAMLVAFQMLVSSDSALANYYTIQLRDGASGAGTLLCTFRVSVPAGFASVDVSINGAVIVAAFSGAKTFYANLSSAQGTPYMTAGATNPAHLLATWSA